MRNVTVRYQMSKQELRMYDGGSSKITYSFWLNVQSDHVIACTNRYISRQCPFYTKSGYAETSITDTL